MLCTGWQHAPQTDACISVSSNQPAPLGYRPFVGYEGTNQIADLVHNSFTLGMEDHLLEMMQAVTCLCRSGRFSISGEEAVSHIPAQSRAQDPIHHTARRV